MTRTVTSLYRYPVKGLSEEALRTVHLEAGRTFPHDRQFAIVHLASKFDPKQPSWITRRNFAVRAYSPSLAKISVRFETATRTLICHVGEQALNLHLDSDTCETALNRLLDDVTIDTQPGPYSIAEVEDTALTDSPEPLISLMNTRSLRDLSEKTGLQLEQARFRGNVWFDGASAWEERDWCGDVLTMGGARVQVVEEIVRCGAIDVHPRQGVRDMTLLRKLDGIYGHSYFGVLAKVLSPGRLVIGSSLEKCLPQTLRSLGI